VLAFRRPPAPQSRAWPTISSRSSALAIIPIDPTSPAGLLTIGGRSVLDATIRALRAVPAIGPIVLALEGVDASAWLAAIERPEELRVSATSTHADRWRAIAEALEAEPSLDTVVLHEPERPLLTPASVMALLTALRDGGVVLGVAVHESIKRVVDGLVVGSVARETVHAVQAPFVFRREPFAMAVRQAVADRWTCRDELQLARMAGIRLHLVDGSRSNLPIRSARDARFAELRSGAGERGLDVATAGR
jgi:2-C-methyl-D-erythritol 4-phosphate cytidylyltransferase